MIDRKLVKKSLLCLP